MLRRVRLLFVLVALVVLATGAVQAAPRLAGPRPVSESGGVLDRLWGWLSAWFPISASSSGGMKSAREMEGSHLDPNGGGD
jgi:hypothetical protein